MIELTFYDFHEHYYEIRDKKFPTFNNNPGKDTTPPSRKELEQTRKLDQLYRDHFNKK